MNPDQLTIPLKGYATILVDFENLYYHFKHRHPRLADPQLYVLDIVRTLREKLRVENQLETLVLNVYADFERIGPASSLGAFYLMGANTRNVLGTDHKNAADMQLCIDALEVMYTRPDINTFIFLAGDRDYIPVIQHLHRQGRQVKVAGFRSSVSGDLLQIVGENNWINCQDMLSKERIATLETLESEPVPVITPVIQPVLRSNHATAISAAIMRQEVVAEPALEGVAHIEYDGFGLPKELNDEDELTCLQLMLDEMAHRRTGEIWLSPFLRRLPDLMPQLNDFDRRNLIESLKAAAVLQIEKIPAEPYHYSVIRLNYNHPDVRRLYADAAVEA